MAVIYTNANNGLFNHLGKIVKHYGLLKTDAGNLSADQLDIADAIALMTIGDPDKIVDGFDATVESWQNAIVGWRSALRDLAEKRLGDVESILNEIGATSDDAAAVIAKLIPQMIADSETVLKSTVTIGSPTAAGTNTGDGTVITTTILDGVTSPGAGSIGTFPAHADYRGVLSQLAVASETMRLECVADSFSGSVAEGAELWNWTGKIADVAHGVASQGSGDIGSLTSLHGQTAIILNGTFETWTGSAADSWDLVAGTWGTHLAEETTLADVYHGDSALKLTGDGAQANIEISQDVANSKVIGGKMYAVACRVYGATGLASGDLTIQFEGTGYAAGSSEKISLDSTALAAIGGGYSLQSFFVIMPDVIPDDFKLVVRYNGTPENAKSIRIDDLAFNSVTYGGGIGIAIVRGSTPWVASDRLTFSVTNDEDGVFQSFFRDAFGYQLPSDDSGSETIDDALIA